MEGITIMSTSMQHHGAQRVNQRSEAPLGVPTYVSVREAARLSGLSELEIRNRVNAGRLDSQTQLIVSTEQLAGEITERRRVEFTSMFKRIGIEPTDDVMARFGFEAEGRR